jgi:RNA polymerase sigma-70 factor (ECF subfamily)
MTTDAAELRALLIHDAFLRRLAGRLVDASSADDVVQDTWLTALRRAPREAAAAKAWLAQVARNFAAMDFRARERAERREAAAARPEAAPSAEEIVEREGVRRDVVEALLRLDALYRDALLLRYERDLPPRKVAAALGVPVETARSRIKRGLDLLRAELTSRRGTERWRSAVGLLLAPTVPRVSVAAASATVGAVLLAVVGAVRLLGGFGAAADAPLTTTPSPVRTSSDTAAPAGAVQVVARQPYAGSGFRILSDEETLDAFPCAEPTDAEGRPRLIATRVVDLLTGRPLPGAVVSLEEEAHAPIGDPPRPLRTATADADGWVRIRVDDLHDRPYGFFVSAEGRATVADFGSRPECPVALPPPRTRRVRAVDVFGAPLVALRLDVVTGCGHHATRERLTTDAAGEVDVGGLGEEGVYVWPVDPRVVTDEHDVAPARPGEPETLVLTCEPSIAVRGRVVRAGVPVAGVFVGAPHRHRGPWAKTDLDGSFALFGAPPGEALLVREAPSPSSPDVPRGKERDLGGMARPPVAHPCTIDLARRGVDSTESPVAVAAQCLDAVGAPVAGVAVCALGADGDVDRAVSDASGVATLRLFPGRYGIRTDDALSEGDVEPRTFDVPPTGAANEPVVCRVAPRPRLRCVVEGADDDVRVTLATSNGVRRLSAEESSGARAFAVPHVAPIALIVDGEGFATVRRRLDDAREKGGTEPVVVAAEPAPPAAPRRESAPLAFVTTADGRPVADAEIACAEVGGDARRAAILRSAADGAVRPDDFALRGPTAFAVRADGYAPFFATTADAGPQRFALSAGAVVAQVADDAGAPLRHATVLIDGEPLYLRGGDASSVTLRGLAAGRHEAIVAAPGRIARRIVFELDDGATAELSARLRKTL